VVALLDVNVLVALFDPVHTHHEAAHQWFDLTVARDGGLVPLPRMGWCG
jgi:predicted nucleic acid-binding protein